MLAKKRAPAEAAAPPAKKAATGLASVALDIQGAAHVRVCADHVSVCGAQRVSRNGTVIRVVGASGVDLGVGGNHSSARSTGAKYYAGRVYGAVGDNICMIATVRGDGNVTNVFGGGTPVPAAAASEMETPLAADERVGDVILRGSGTVHVERGACHPRRFAITLSGAGDVVVADGTTEFAVVRLEGSGEVNAAVRADDVRLSLTGSGDIRGLYASKKLRCAVSGSGNVECSHAKDADTEVERTGSGRVRLTAADASGARRTQKK